MMKTIKITAGLCALAFMLIMASCTDGYKDDSSFDSGVHNQVLKTLLADDISCTLSATGDAVTISWPVVYGAGGYRFALYNNDDPDVPVTLVEPTIVDACSYTYDGINSDSKYSVEVQALGKTDFQPNNDNKDAESQTTKVFTTISETYKTIPGGDEGNPTDLIAWFGENPIPTAGSDDLNDEAGAPLELAYQLEADKYYIINDSILDLTNIVPKAEGELGNPLSHKIILRGEKAGHAKVKLVKKGAFGSQSGMSIKFIDIDASEVSSNKGVLTMPATPDENIKASTGQYIVFAPVVFQSCNINDVNGYLVFDNSQKYCYENLVFKDCVVKFGTSPCGFKMEAGSYIYLTLQNSTFWCTIEDWASAFSATTYFFRVGGNSAFKINNLNDVCYAVGGCTINCCTFYNIVKTGQMANWNQYNGRSQITLDIQKNIFVDTSQSQVFRRLCSNGNNTTVYGQNTEWLDGEETSATKDSQTKEQVFLLSQPFDFTKAKQGDFTVTGEEQLAQKTGDPRWLP